MNNLILAYKSYIKYNSLTTYICSDNFKEDRNRPLSQGSKPNSRKILQDEQSII